MIDVHPPHTAAHSWREFCVHIATIVIGLLIAIGLEQTVEAIHQHREARETHEALQREYEINRRSLSEEAVLWKRGTAALQNNLLVFQYLQQHPRASQDELPGILVWDISSVVFTRSAWSTAQQTGIVKLLPQLEVTNDSYLYLYLQRVEDASNNAWLAINDAEQFALNDPDPTHLTPNQLSSVIALTEKALTLQILCGEALINLGSFPNLPPTITRLTLDAIRNRNGTLSPSLRAARAVTLARLVATNRTTPCTAPIAAPCTAPIAAPCAGRFRCRLRSGPGSTRTGRRPSGKPHA